MAIILTIADYYRPGYKGGGPIRTLESLVDHLGDTFDFRIMTRDRDLGDDTPYPGIGRDSWQPVGQAQVRYVSPGGLRPDRLAHLLRETPHDLLYLNSFFSTVSVSLMTLRRLGRIPRQPLIVAPRGEFFAGALALKSTKKRAYWVAAQATGLLRQVTRWQASNADEAETIRHLLPDASIHVAPNLQPRSLPQVDLGPRPLDPVRLVFFSRIARKKNLHLALDALAESSIDAVLDIYGSTEDADYWRECQDRMAALPPTIQASYHGTLHPADVASTLSRYHGLLLPTAGENYGHVIWEALYAGCLPLISDRTPWHDLEAHGIGWERPLEDRDAWHAALREIARLTPEAHAERAAAAHAYARRVADDADAVAANRRLFSDLE